jgi:hypothetical protein
VILLAVKDRELAIVVCPANVAFCDSPRGHPSTGGNDLFPRLHLADHFGKLFRQLRQFSSSVSPASSCMTMSSSSSVMSEWRDSWSLGLE